MELESAIPVLGESYELLLDKPFASVYHFKDSKIGYVYWKKSASFEEYKKPFEVLLEKHKKNPIDYFLSDIINQGVTSSEKKDWFREIALKKAIDGGVKKGAVIINDNPFKEFYVNIVLKATNKMGLPFKIFRNVDQAKDWLVK